MQPRRRLHAIKQRVRAAQLTDLRGDAVARALGDIEAAFAAGPPRLEHRVVGLHERGDVVPERRGQLGRGLRVCRREERAVAFFRRVIFRPAGPGLDAGARVGGVDGVVEHGEGDGVDVVDPEGRWARGWGERRRDVACGCGGGVRAVGVVCVGELEEVCVGVAEEERGDGGFVAGDDLVEVVRVVAEVVG